MESDVPSSTEKGNRRAIGGCHCRHLLWSLATIAILILLSLSPTPSHSDDQRRFEENRRIIPDLMLIIVEHGWVADMGRLCAIFELGSEGDCRFKQIAVSESPPGVVDNYGFNVPLNTPTPSYAVLFHLGPLVGNFFVVSADGTLKSSFFRAKGKDFTKIPNSDARSAFERSMTFWAENLPRLKAKIWAGDAPKR
jgi:hypothetical protein